MKIALYKNALAQILTSAVDAFPKECFGQLLGKKHCSTFKLSSAYSMSSLRRSENYIFYRPEKVKKLETIFEKIYQNEKILGTYHSHPNENINSNIKLSEEDKEKNLESENIQIIISIKKTKSMRDSLKYSKNKRSILGIINRHSFKIEGFYYNENEQEFKRTLFCPLSKSLIDRINS